MNKARFKVEHLDTTGKWVPVHRGTIKTYSAALDKKQAACRVMVDWLGNGVWEDMSPDLGSADERAGPEACDRELDEMDAANATGSAS
jgi:hypothetical protein